MTEGEVAARETTSSTTEAGLQAELSRLQDFLSEKGPDLNQCRRIAQELVDELEGLDFQRVEVS